VQDPLSTAFSTNFHFNYFSYLNSALSAAAILFVNSTVMMMIQCSTLCSQRCLKIRYHKKAFGILMSARFLAYLTLPTSAQFSASRRSGPTTRILSGARSDLIFRFNESKKAELRYYRGEIMVGDCRATSSTLNRRAIWLEDATGRQKSRPSSSGLKADGLPLWEH